MISELAETEVVVFGSVFSPDGIGVVPAVVSGDSWCSVREILLLPMTEPTFTSLKRLQKHHCLDLTQIQVGIQTLG